VKALVIDDSRAVRMLISRLLVAHGFETVHAGHGGEALDALAACGPDRPQVALVDWNMPVMDGLTFVSRVRATPQYRDITLMMVTTESEQDQIVRALAAGAHEYLIKPFTEDALLSKLALLGLLPVAAVPS
jgi:two-component system, chemotaxis family, chemotaxis protein CheY